MGPPAPLRKSPAHGRLATSALCHKGEIMALGKRSGVISATNANDVKMGKDKAAKIVGDKVPTGDSDSDESAVIGADGGPAMKKYGQHIGAAAHGGEVMHAGERLQ